MPKQTRINQTRGILTEQSPSSATSIVLHYWRTYDGLQISDEQIQILSQQLSSPEAILRGARRAKHRIIKDTTRQIKEDIMRWIDEDNYNCDQS